MLSYKTIEPHTLELLKSLADEQFMPLMFESVTWEEMRKTILEKVRSYAYKK